MPGKLLGAILSSFTSQHPDLGTSLPSNGSAKAHRSSFADEAAAAPLNTPPAAPDPSAAAPDPSAAAGHMKAAAPTANADSSAGGGDGPPPDEPGGTSNPEAEAQQKEANAAEAKEEEAKEDQPAGGANGVAETETYNPSDAAPPQDQGEIQEKVKSTLNDMKLVMKQIIKKGHVLSKACTELGKKPDKFSELGEKIKESQKMLEEMRQAVVPLQAQIKRMQKIPEEASMALPSFLLPLLNPPPLVQASVSTSQSGYDKPVQAVTTSLRSRRLRQARAGQNFL